LTFCGHISKELAYYLEQAGKTGAWNKRAHHYYPVALEQFFVKLGIDINAGPATGEWMSLSFHKLIHRRKTNGLDYGHGGPWNYQWHEFRKTNPTVAEVIAFKDDLLRRISDKRKKIDWLYNPQKPEA
jgi:hypothetical protein